MPSGSTGIVSVADGQAASVGGGDTIIDLLLTEAFQRAPIPPGTTEAVRLGSGAYKINNKEVMTLKMIN